MPCAHSLPEQPLQVWMYDASPFVKLVREVLCELEIPYLLKSAARGSPKRDELFERVGHFQVSVQRPSAFPHSLSLLEKKNQIALIKSPSS